MVLNFISVLTLLACLSLPFLSARSAFMLVSAFSFSGTYALSFEGGLNILPGAVLAALLCLWLALKAISAGTLGRIPRFPGAAYLIPFLLYAVIVTVGAPMAFGGKILVVRPNLVSEGVHQAVPLGFSVSNIAQLTYLVLDAMLLIGAAALARRPDFKMSSVISFHFRLAVIMACAVALETILGISGLPIDIFSWIMGPEFGEIRLDRYYLQDLFGFPIRRAQAVFGEPSVFTAYMIGIFGAALFYVRTKPTPRAIFRVLITCAALLASLSTTGIAGMVLIAVLVAFAPGSGNVDSRTVRRRHWIFIVALASLIIGVGVAVFSSGAVSDYLFGKLTDTEGYEEGNYSSGAERLFWDITATRAIWNSLGVGVGAGATRASSFVLNIGAAFGVAGLILLAALLRHLWRAFYHRLSLIDDVDVRAASVMCLGWFVGFAISIPDGFIFFYIWILLGFILMRTSPKLAVGFRRKPVESAGAIKQSGNTP